MEETAAQLAQELPGLVDAATPPGSQQVTESTPERAVAAFATALDGMYADRLQPATGNGTGSATDAAGPESAMTAIDANSSIARIDMAIRATTDQLSNLGAFQNRLESVVRGADYAVENLAASDSRIRDVSMATERIDYTKNNVLLQASQAMLAQANQIPQGVLRLLG